MTTETTRVVTGRFKMTLEHEATFTPDEYLLLREVLIEKRQWQVDYLTGKGQFQTDGLRERTRRKDPTLNTEAENLAREEARLAHLNNIVEKL